MPKTCWILSEGLAGTENQCLGLAERLGLPVTVKRLAIAAPWRHLPLFLWPNPLTLLAHASDPLSPPWPDLIIAAGRKTAPVALALRAKAAKEAGTPPFTVFTQTPPVAPHHFDVVIAPAHDRLKGKNVIRTRGALTRVTDEKLAREAAGFALSETGKRLAELPAPRVAVLVGGPNRRHKMTPDAMAALGTRLRDAASRQRASLLVTTSRRTGPLNVAALADALAGFGNLIFWDGTRQGDDAAGRGPNPYFAFLAAADVIVVTPDSVSMASEAVATGKPVYVADLPGGSTKFERFHQSLAAAGATRPFLGSFQRWDYPRFDDTAEAAQRVREMAGL